ncbi:hypothetical protein CCP2SC5_400015 [Azospirillaceae bacterium]
MAQTMMAQATAMGSPTLPSLPKEGAATIGVSDRLISAVLEANERLPEIAFLALIGDPKHPITLDMCDKGFACMTIYRGGIVDEALTALRDAVAALESGLSPTDPAFFAPLRSEPPPVARRSRFERLPATRRKRWRLPFSCSPRTKQ